MSDRIMVFLILIQKILQQTYSKINEITNKKLNKYEEGIINFLYQKKRRRTKNLIMKYLF